MSERPIDPRYSAAFQRRSRATTAETLTDPRPPVVDRPRTDAPPGEPVAPEPVTIGPTELQSADQGPREGVVSPVDRVMDGRGHLLWTIALFLIGAGLCALSFALYSEYNFLRWPNATPISGTDQWVISDGTGYGTRTVDRFEVVFPQYMSQMSIWIGAVGVATIVVNFFRLARSSAT